MCGFPMKITWGSRGKEEGGRDLVELAMGALLGEVFIKGLVVSELVIRINTVRRSMFFREA
jgi:hypothetical protein